MIRQLALCKSIYHLHSSDCASNKCSNCHCVWDWYLSLTCTAIKQAPASHTTPLCCFSFPHFLTPKVSVFQDSIVLVTFSQWYGWGSHSLWYDTVSLANEWCVITDLNVCWCAVLWPSAACINHTYVTHCLSQVAILHRLLDPEDGGKAIWSFRTMETIHPSDAALHPRRLVSSTCFPYCVVQIWFSEVCSGDQWCWYGVFPLPDVQAVPVSETERYMVRDKTFLDYGNITLLGLPLLQVGIVPFRAYTLCSAPHPLLEASLVLPSLDDVQHQLWFGLHYHPFNWIFIFVNRKTLGSFCLSWSDPAGPWTREVSFVCGHHSADGAHILKQPASCFISSDKLQWHVSYDMSRMLKTLLIICLHSDMTYFFQIFIIPWMTCMLRIHNQSSAIFEL